MSEDRIRQLAEKLTLAEQVSLLSGEDLWSLPAIERLGIGKLRVTDGPNGARGGGGLVGGVSAAAFPVGICLGASWNVALLREIGSALADEVKSKGAHVSLSPTVNIQRSVTNGRNFECFAEDPVLTAHLAGAFIAGLQDKHVAATIKHFAGNESEIERTSMNSVIDERTLREVYLLPFEHAVKVAGTWAIMASYNRLNGEFAAESRWLLTGVLRNEWRYTGLVMSDWFGSHSTAPTVNAGLDLEMPGPTRDRGQQLIDAEAAAAVTPDTIRQSALNVLRLMDRTGALDDHRPHVERADDRPEHRALIRRAGAEGMVLLKNDGLLPLDPKSVAGKVAVIGPNAQVAQIMGGGSSQLNPHYRVSPWDGLVAAFGEDRLVFAAGPHNRRFEPMLTNHWEVEFFNSPDLSGPVVHREELDGGEIFIFAPPQGVTNSRLWSARYTTTFIPGAAGNYRLGLAAAAYGRVKVDGDVLVDIWGDRWTPGRTYFDEGSDEQVADIHMEAGEPYVIELEIAKKPLRIFDLTAARIGLGRIEGDAVIADAVSAAKAADIAIVCVGRNGEWDTEGSDLDDILLPGRQDELVQAVTAANPRTIVVLQTGGPVEMPWLGDVAAVLQAWYPGQEAGNAIADVLTGAAEPGGRLAQTFPVRWNDNPTFTQDREIYPGLNGKVRYEEGVFVGYRHYDKQAITPLFPFGFGLSYTRFELSDFAIDDSKFEADGNVTVTVTVTNTGSRAGSTVVQLYVGDPEASVPRPNKELKAFAKVHLKPGHHERLRLELSERDFAFYDITAQHWVVEPGAFTLLLGTSAVDIAFTGEVRAKNTLLIPV